MMDIFDNSSERNTTGAQDWTEVYEAVRWIQLVMALLSVLGSGSIICCLMFNRLSRTPELQPLLLLSVSDLLLASCWLVGVVLYSQHCSRLSVHCYNMHRVEQALYLASFFYTLNYVWNLFRGLREKLHSCCSGYSMQISNRVKTTDKLIALLSCFLPLLLTAPMFIQGNISQCHANFSQPYRCLLMHTGALFVTPERHQLIPACSLLHTYSTAVFLGSFLLTLFGITSLVMKSRSIHRRVVTSHGYLGNQQQASLRLMDRRMILYPLIFILCWGPAVALASLRVLRPLAPQGRLGVVLFVSQAATSASQGFFNSLVYGWTRLRLRLRRAAMLPPRRDMDTQTPLLRAQRRGRSYQTLKNVC